MSLVMSEEQDLALTVWGTVVALGAEVTCTFEGKGRLCPRLPLWEHIPRSGWGSCRANRAEAEMTFETPAIAFSAQELMHAGVGSSSGTFPVPVSVLHQAWAN